jgi:outer membrane protein OmpA-like peptidoglycan-associated protein
MPLPIKYILILLFISLKGIGQEYVTLSIYYESNVHTLNESQKHVIDSLLNNYAFESIELKGFADTVGKRKANLRISALRADHIETYIHKHISTAKISSSANGEQDYNNSNNSLQNQRRVDIILTLTSIETIEITQERIIEVNPENNGKVIKNETTSSRNQFKQELLNNDKIIVENLLFEPGKTIFLYNKIPNELYYLADLMDSIPSLEIKIEGHVCCVDDRKLSTERAKSVYLFLRGTGVDKHRMLYEGFSNEKPLVEEKTAEDQKLNRRVEILITKR